MNGFAGKAVLHIINNQAETYDVYIDGAMAADALGFRKSADVWSTNGVHRIELRSRKSGKSVYSTKLYLCTRCSAVIKRTLILGTFVEYVQE